MLLDGFVNPLLAFGVGLALVPLIIHLLNRQRHKPMPWAAMRFVLAAYKRTRRRARIENLFLLLLRMAAVALLALAVARPYTGSESPLSALTESRRNLLLALDGSASTGYREEIETTFEGIVERAREILLELDGGRGDSVHLLFCGEYPRLLSWRTPEEALSLLNTLLQPTDESLNLVAALGEILRVAEEDAAGTDTSSLEVRILTDLQRRSFDPAPVAGTAESLAQDQPGDGTSGGAPPMVDALDALHELGVKVLVEDLGPAETTPPNLAVSSIEPTSTILGPSLALDIAVTVRNHGAASRSGVRVLLAVDGERRPYKTVEVPARDSARVVFTVAIPEAGAHTLEARVDADRLTIDDLKSSILVVPPPVRILLVNGAPHADIEKDEVGFLQAVLEPAGGDVLPGAENSAPFRVRTIDPSALDDSDVQWADFDLILLANVARITGRTAQRFEEWVAAGGALMITAGDRLDVSAYNTRLFRADGTGLLPAELLDRVAVASRRESYFRVQSFREDHPALEFFADERWKGLLTEVPVYEFIAAQPLEDARVLARLDDDGERPLLVERSYDRGLVLLWTSTIDPAWTRLPESPRTLVPLVHEMVRYAGSSREASRNVAVGEILQAEVRTYPRDLSLVRPDGSRRPIDEEPEASGAGLWRLPAIQGTERAGIYRFEMEGAPSIDFAVSVDEEEGDLMRLEDTNLAALHPAFSLVQRNSAGDGARDSEKPKKGELWRWLVAACIAALVMESLWAAWLGRSRNRVSA